MKNLHVKDVKTKWLTDTPDVESVIKGSHFPRIVTFIRFDQFIFFNTHLDYASDEICLEQAKCLMNIVKKEINDHDKVVLVGDFNMHPESKTIMYMHTYFRSFYQGVLSNELLTYHAFSDRTEGKPIDYMFYTNNVIHQDFKIHRHEKMGIYISDHYPISAEFTF